MAKSYFAIDCKAISVACLQSPDIWARAAIFVILTIQQQFSIIRLCMDDVDSCGPKSRFLWGSKAESYDYIMAHKAILWSRAVAFHNGDISLDSLVFEYMAIPGIGIAKASFLAQLTVGVGACLDVHNLRLLGLSVNEFKTPKTLKPQTIMRRIEAYGAVCARVASSAVWWDSWCDHIAIKYRKHFANGAAVSRLHRDCILGDIEGKEESIV